MRRSRDSSDQADIGRFALLFILVVAVIGVLGLIGFPRQSESMGTAIRIIVTALAGGVMFASIRIARITEQRKRWAGTLLGVLVVAAMVGFLVTANPFFGKAISVMWILLVLAAPVTVLRQVLASEDVTVQTILGSITVYLLIGVSLALVAIAMQQSIGFFEVAPRSTAYVYFAFVTNTSLGYGDLSPFTDPARMISVLAAVAAQIYLVIVVARLVSIWSPRRSTPRSDPDR